MKIAATLSKINVLGDSSGDITTTINEKEYHLTYKINPYYFDRKNNDSRKRTIAINFPDSKTLSDFGIEVDFSKVKWGIARSLVQSIKDRELARIREREEAYDKAPIHKLTSDMKDLLAATFVYKGITITPTFIHSTKKDFVASYYDANGLALFIKYEWLDSEKNKHNEQFTIETKLHYRHNILNETSYSFKRGYTSFKGVWKRLDKIVLKIEETVRDSIDSAERSIEGSKKRKAYIVDTKNELGYDVIETSGHLACIKREPILEGEEYKKKNYEYERKVEFSRWKDDKGTRYHYINLGGSYTVDQMKRIIEIAMEAKPEEVYKNT